MMDKLWPLASGHPLAELGEDYINYIDSPHILHCNPPTNIPNPWNNWVPPHHPSPLFKKQIWPRNSFSNRPANRDDAARCRFRKRRSDIWIHTSMMSGSIAITLPSIWRGLVMMYSILWKYIMTANVDSNKLGTRELSTVCILERLSILIILE